jgi:hypothetical protein
MSSNIYLPVQNLQRTEIKTFGLCWILYFLHRDIESWPVMDPVNGVINASLVFKNGAQFYTAQFIEKERQFIENQRESQAGPYVESSVQGILGGNNLNHITGIQAMMGGQFGLLIQERNGEQRLIGSADSGAKFMWDYTSGVESTSRKRNCKWIYESPYGVPVYQGGNVIINDQIIPVGGSSGSGGGGSFAKHTGFIVGVTTMINGELSYTHADLMNKNVLVFADGVKIPQTAAATGTRRTIQKAYNATTIYFEGGVVANEFIEIFTY